MVISAESAPLVVTGWLLVAALLGAFTILQMMRRRVIPVTPMVVAFSMGLGALMLFPAPLMNLSSVMLLKWFLIFVLVDMLLISLAIRFQLNNYSAR